MNSKDRAKKAAGKKAAELIPNQSIVGLGSGSTAAYFIEELIERCKNGLVIQAVASSQESKKIAESGGMKVLSINEVDRIDITVDGADEIDDQKQMIKGAGGAHVREKILASSSREMVVIVDSSKLVKKLGIRDLPVEVMQYGYLATEKKIISLGLDGKWRKKTSGEFFVTDNQNYLYDIHFSSPPSDLSAIHKKLLLLPGVIDTGFFQNIAGRVIVGYEDGTSIIQS